MFKNAIVYRLAASWQPDFQQLEQALEAGRFQPCTATQASSGGWTAPRGHAGDALLESVGGQWLLRYQQEKKLLPAPVVQARVDEKCAAIEAETGRKPGKKEQRDLKEEALLDLLPQAFSQRSSLWVWIDPQARWLVVDASAQGKADAVVSLLSEHLTGFALALLDTHTSAQAGMAHWLLEQQAPAGFSLDQECELKASDGSQAVIRYSRHPVEIDEVRQHVQQGKLPSKLAMTWQGRVSFTLTEALQLKKITWLDVVLQDAGDDTSGFDADASIATTELGQLLPDLVAALDGEGRSAVVGGEAAPNPTMSTVLPVQEKQEAQEVPEQAEDLPPWE